jgi:hypothetical protein
MAAVRLYFLKCPKFLPSFDCTHFYFLLLPRCLSLFFPCQQHIMSRKAQNSEGQPAGYRSNDRHG